MKPVDLDAEDIILELVDKVNALIVAHNRFDITEPKTKGKALEKAVQKTAEQFD